MRISKPFPLLNALGFCLILASGLYSGETLSADAELGSPGLKCQSALLSPKDLEEMALRISTESDQKDLQASRLMVRRSWLESLQADLDPALEGLLKRKVISRFAQAEIYNSSDPLPRWKNETEAVEVEARNFAALLIHRLLAEIKDPKTASEIEIAGRLALFKVKSKTELEHLYELPVEAYVQFYEYLVQGMLVSDPLVAQNIEKHYTSWRRKHQVLVAMGQWIGEWFTKRPLRLHPLDKKEVVIPSEEAPKTSIPLPGDELSLTLALSRNETLSVSWLALGTFTPQQRLFHLAIRASRLNLNQLNELFQRSNAKDLLPSELFHELQKRREALQRINDDYTLYDELRGRRLRDRSQLQPIDESTTTLGQYSQAFLEKNIDFIGDSAVHKALSAHNRRGSARFFSAEIVEKLKEREKLYKETESTKSQIEEAKKQKPKHEEELRSVSASVEAKIHYLAHLKDRLSKLELFAASMEANSPVKDPIPLLDVHEVLDALHTWEKSTDYSTPLLRMKALIAFEEIFSPYGSKLDAGGFERAMDVAFRKTSSFIKTSTDQGDRQVVELFLNVFRRHAQHIEKTAATEKQWIATFTEHFGVLLPSRNIHGVWRPILEQVGDLSWTTRPAYARESAQKEVLRGQRELEEIEKEVSEAKEKRKAMSAKISELKEKIIALEGKEAELSATTTVREEK
ncbi:MAG: hypothetical protein AB1540_10380 [Bdellovibrionota bacterium]